MGKWIDSWLVGWLSEYMAVSVDYVPVYNMYFKGSKVPGS